MASVNDDLAVCLRAWIRKHAAGPGTVRIECEASNGHVCKLVVLQLPAPEPFPSESAPPVPDADETVFQPNQLQQDILEALQGGPLTAEALAAAVGVSKRYLFRKPGGVQELVEHGLVKNSRETGYFRPEIASGN